MTGARTLTQREIDVIRVTLERGARTSTAPSLVPRIAELRAVSGCDCGCDTIDFAEYLPAGPHKPIAEATGTTEAGGQVGLIVWGTDHAIMGLEI